MNKETEQRAGSALVIISIGLIAVAGAVLVVGAVVGLIVTASAH